MIRVEGYCYASGPMFSPKAVVAEQYGVQYVTQNEPGEIAKTGRYRGQPEAEGTARWNLPGGPLVASEDDWKGTAAVIASCKRYGAKEVVVHLNIQYSGQCNFEIPSWLLGLLGGLGVTLSVTCYADENLSRD